MDCLSLILRFPFSLEAYLKGGPLSSTGVKKISTSTGKSNERCCERLWISPSPALVSKWGQNYLQHNRNGFITEELNRVVDQKLPKLFLHLPF